MECMDCKEHTDDTRGGGAVAVGDKHWLHLPSVPNERLCRLMGHDNLWLVGSFPVGTSGRGMQEDKVPGCPYVSRVGG